MLGTMAQKNRKDFAISHATARSRIFEKDTQVNSLFKTKKFERNLSEIGRN